MEFDEVKATAVVGAGEVGHGIALGLGMAGYQVRLNSTTEASLQKGMDSIKTDLDRLVELGFVELDRAQAALTNISTTTSLEEASRDVDVVFEAVYENLELKQRNIQRVGRVLSGADNLGQQHLDDNSQPFCRGDSAARPCPGGSLHGAILPGSAGGDRAHRTDLE